MKKTSLLLLIAMIAPFSLLAAGSGEDSGSGDSENVTVTIMSRWSEDMPSSRFFRNHLAEMDAADPSLTIVQDNINDEMAYYDKLRTKFATGEFPNIFFNYGGSRLVDYVESDVLVDMAPYLDADPTWKNGFQPVFDKWMYGEYSGIWGIPAEFYAVGIFYNKGIFAELGIETPATMKEWESACDKLLAAGYIPMALGEKDVWRAGHFSNNLIMKAYGAQAVSDLADRSMTYDDPKMIDIFEMIQDYNDRGYFGPNAVNMGGNMEKTSFHTGESAMHMDGSWYLSEASESPIFEQIGVFPFPAIEPAYAESWQGGAGGGFSVVDTGNRNEIDASVEIIKSITIPSYMKQLQTENKGGVYPVKFDPDESVVGHLTIEYMNMLEDAEEYRDDVQTYDPISSLLETVRLAIQGLFVGNTPDECAAEIVAEIEAAG